MKLALRPYGSPLAYVLALATLLGGLAACEEDFVEGGAIDLGRAIGEREPTTVSAFGVLTDAAGAPISGADVRAGDAATVTNDDGYWRLDDVDAAVTLARFTFSGAGYLDGSRNVYAEPGGTYELDVELLGDGPAGRVDAVAGGAVELPGGASVTFGPGAFARADGSPVAAGEVAVAAHYLDPGLESTYRQMPGDLRGAFATDTAARDLQLLTTYGMMAVELTDGSGNEIVLADGQTATLRMPVPEGARGAAPAEMPLWFFDEGLGVWREEGVATLVGDAYVGQVSHFTFWNCDIPTAYVQLCGQITFEAAADAADSTGVNARLAVVSENYGTTYGYTDADGSFCGIVPAGEALTLEVRGAYGYCEDPAATFPLGSLSADTDLGPLTVPAAEATLVTVTGSGVCDGAPVSDGAAFVEVDGRRVATVGLGTDGSFETSFVACASDERTYDLVVVDYGAASQSAAVSVASAEAGVDFGAVAACEEELESFLRITVDGSAVLFPFASGFVGRDTLSVSSERDCEFAVASFVDADTDIGTLGTKTLDASGASSLFLSNGCDAFPPGLAQANIPLGGRTLEVTAVPNVDFDRYAGRLAPGEYTVPLDSTGRDTTYTLAIEFAF